MRKAFLMVALLAVSAIGCRGQHAVTSNGVNLTLTAPAGAQASYVYVFSRAAVTGSTCPAATTGTYAALNDATATAATSYFDGGSAGTKVCYVAQTKDTGVSPAAYSVPSNIAGPFTVPADPLAPSITGSPGAETASADPAPSQPAMLPARAVDKRMPAPILTATVVGK